MLARLHASLCVLLVFTTLAHALTPAEAWATAYQDCQRLPADAQIYTRYFYDPKIEEEKEMATALTLQVHFLSREVAAFETSRPVKIAPGLWRIRYDSYGWKKETWESLAASDPYYHDQGEEKEVVVEERVKQWYGKKLPDGSFRYDYFKWETRKVKKKVGGTELTGSLPNEPVISLVALTKSQVPLVRAEWFIANTCRDLDQRNRNDHEHRYRDFLQIQNRDDLFALVKFKLKDSQEVGRYLKEAIKQSGVSQQGRQVIVAIALTGWVFYTLDTFDPTKKGNPLVHLKDNKDGTPTLQHDAEEIFAVLPNGLPVTLACDAQGVLQDYAPGEIGPDDSLHRVGNDSRIHNNLSCIRCHGTDGSDFLKAVPEWVRKGFRPPNELGDKDYKEFLKIQAAYFRQLNSRIDEARLSYSNAVKELTGMTVKDAMVIYCKQYNRYVEEGVTAQQAALELGIKEDELRSLILSYFPRSKGGGILVDVDDPGKPLMDYLIPGETLPRLMWEDVYPIAAKLAYVKGKK